MENNDNNNDRNAESDYSSAGEEENEDFLGKIDEEMDD